VYCNVYTCKEIKIFEINDTYIPLHVVFCADVKWSATNHKGHVRQVSYLVAVKLKGKRNPLD